MQSVKADGLESCGHRILKRRDPAKYHFFFAALLRYEIDEMNAHQLTATVR
jgi:hypothetical protein